MYNFLTYIQLCIVLYIVLNGLPFHKNVENFALVVWKISLKDISKTRQITFQ